MKGKSKPKGTQRKKIKLTKSDKLDYTVTAYFSNQLFNFGLNTSIILQIIIILIALACNEVLITNISFLLFSVSGYAHNIWQYSWPKMDHAFSLETAKSHRSYNGHPTAKRLKLSQFLVVVSYEVVLEIDFIWS